MPFLLALDQGTTSSRAIVFNENGHIVALEQREFEQFYPQPGWVEHDPAEIWNSQIEVAAAALSSADLRSTDVSALGITNQRETVVIWNRQTGEPIHRAIVWQDRRTADRCAELRAEGHEPLIREKTGLLLDPYFSGTKIAWLLDNVPDARRDAEAGLLAAGTVDSWLTYNLTGGELHITDASNASRTLLMDIRTGDWNDQLLEIFKVPQDVLPDIRFSSEVYGEVTRDLPLSGIPIAGIAGDQQAALFGQTCFNSGAAKNTYGTGCFMLMNTGTRPVASDHKLLSTVAWNLAGELEYALEGSVFTGGAVVSWLRDGLGIIKASSDIEALATSVPDSGDVYLVPAFVGLGAPHWDPYARGTMIGITGGITAAHIARAALDSIIFQVADLVSAMKTDSHIPLTELRVDGGASVNNYLLQRQADILQIPVLRPAVTESTALGAAYLAGLAVGVWPNIDTIAHKWTVDRRFEPQIPADSAHAQVTRWQQAVERAKQWAQPS